MKNISTIIEKEGFKSKLDKELERNFEACLEKESFQVLVEKLRLPKKSILITIDDGSRAENFIPLLEEYQVNATLFLIGIIC